MNKQWSFRGTRVDTRDILLLEIPLSLKEKIKVSLIVSNCQKNLDIHISIRHHIVLLYAQKLSFPFTHKKMNLKQTYRAWHRVLLPRLQCIRLLRSANVTLQIHRSWFYCLLVLLAGASTNWLFWCFAWFPSCDFDFWNLWWASHGLRD